MDELIKAMKIAFASENVYYVKASSFHWNIEGSNFPQYHALLDTIYTEVYNARDGFAENIRKLGAYALGSNSSYIKYSADHVSILVGISSRIILKFNELISLR